MSSKSAHYRTSNLVIDREAILEYISKVASMSKTQAEGYVDSQNTDLALFPIDSDEYEIFLLRAQATRLKMLMVHSGK